MCRGCGYYIYNDMVDVSEARSLFVRAVNADTAGFYDEACRLYADGLAKLTAYVNNPGLWVVLNLTQMI